MQRRFLYRANAAGLSATITRPFSEVVEIQAATSLPPTGGFGSARVTGFNYRDLILADSITSAVSGNETAEGVHNTLATVTIEGLNVMGVVTADRVIARLTSEHVGEQETLPVLPVGSSFENLRIAGVPVVPKPHEVLFTHPTFEAIDEACRKKPSAFVDPTGASYCSASAPAGGRRNVAGKGSAAISAYEERLMLTSAFDVPGGRACTGEAVPGWALPVPGFGTVYIGEYLINVNARRLTMLRIELGSPLGGSLDAGIVDGNGSLYP